MPRVIWKGSISFALIEIPVGLYAAESRDEIGFSMLDKRDLAPVGYRRYNKKNGQEVPFPEIVKGYEYAPGEFVLMGDGDFRRANVDKARSVNLVSFVDAADIAPWFFETPYYLEPLRKESKGYALLRETLRRTGKAGVAKFVLRSKEYLAALVTHGDVLLLNTLRFAHELRDTSEIAVPTKDLESLGVSPKELQMAEALVTGMSEAWDPRQYKDDYRDDLMAHIEKKIQAGQTEAIEETAGEETGRRAEVVDLMPLLRKSLEQRGKGEQPAASGGAKPEAASAGTARRKTAARAAPSRKTASKAGAKSRAGRPA
jgi:DNA end-binding protein Ku